MLARILFLCNGSGMNKLDIWLKDNGIKGPGFAKSLGLAPSTIWRLRHDKTTPDLPTAVAIERATDGAVPAACWVEAA